MSKKLVPRSSRFTGPYSFAPPDIDEDGSDVTNVADGPNIADKAARGLTTGKKSRPRFKGPSLEFIISWLDVCIAKKAPFTFQDTVVNEFQKRFGHAPNPKTAQRKVIEWYQVQAGMTGSKFASDFEVMTMGSKCIDWQRAPEQLVNKLDKIRLELRLPSLGKRDSDPNRNPRDTRQTTESQPSSRRSSLGRSSKSTAQQTKDPSRRFVVAPFGSSVDDSVENVQDASEAESTVASEKRGDSELSQQNWRSIEDADVSMTDGDPMANQDPRDQKIEMLSGMLSWMLDRQRHGWNSSEDVITKLNSIQHELSSTTNPSNTFASLLSALSIAEKDAATYRKTLKSMTEPLTVLSSESDAAPQAPSPKAIERKLQLLRQRTHQLSQKVQVERSFVSPSDFDWLHESLEETWGVESQGREQQFRAVMEQSASLVADSVEEVLLKLFACLSRLLFIFVFHYPSKLLEDQHSDLLKHVYGLVAAAASFLRTQLTNNPGNPAEVRRLDLLATSLHLSTLPDSTLPDQEAAECTRYISSMLGLGISAMVDAGSATPLSKKEDKYADADADADDASSGSTSMSIFSDGLVERDHSQTPSSSTPLQDATTLATLLNALTHSAISLYSTLLPSPLTYAIHFFPLHTPFDARSMSGEDAAGAPLPLAACIGKRVRVCVWPGLWQFCGDDEKTEGWEEMISCERWFLRDEVGVGWQCVGKAGVVVE